MIYEVKPPPTPPGGVWGGVDFKNKNSHPKRVYTPSLNLIALKMWQLPTYPQNIAPPGDSPPGGEGGYFGGSCVVTTYLELLSSNLVFKSHLGADLIF